MADASRFDPEAWLNATAPALGLEVAEEWRPNVLSYLTLSARAATLFIDWPLDPMHDELASVFRPGPPR